LKGKKSKKKRRPPRLFSRLIIFGRETKKGATRRKKGKIAYLSKKKREKNVSKKKRRISDVPENAFVRPRERLYRGGRGSLQLLERCRGADETFWSGKPGARVGRLWEASASDIVESGSIKNRLAKSEKGGKGVFPTSRMREINLHCNKV